MVNKNQDDYISKLLLVGAGKGGAIILQLVEGVKDLTIVGVADINSDAPGIKIAEAKGIPTFADYKDALSNLYVDFVVDVTADPKVKKELNSLKGGRFEIISGTTAKLIWRVVEARRKNEQEIKELLDEYKSLYNLGLKLSHFESTDELFPVIAKQAIESAKCLAGCIAVYKEKFGEMEIMTSTGFSKQFDYSKTWEIEPNSLTNKILNKKQPFIITDVTEQTVDNKALIDEGVKSLAASPLFAEGKIVGILYVADFRKRDFSPREISILSLISTLAALAIERAKLLAETKLEAITDGLTGLYNHRHFITRLKEEASRAVRYNNSISLIMFDVDHFKNFNDEFGHLEGNNLLVQIADVLREESRNEDIVARYGGEEFAIVMPQTRKEGAVAFAERIRKMIQNKKFKNLKGETIKKAITVSGGVASCPSDISSFINLIQLADQALYKAKELSRNRIEKA